MNQMAILALILSGVSIVLLILSGVVAFFNRK